MKKWAVLGNPQDGGPRGTVKTLSSMKKVFNGGGDRDLELPAVHAACIHLAVDSESMSLSASAIRHDVVQKCCELCGSHSTEGTVDM